MAIPISEEESSAGAASASTAPTLALAMKRQSWKRLKAMAAERRAGGNRTRFSTKSETVEGEKMFVVSHEQSKIYILGTNHVDPRHVLIVRKLLKELKPDVVGVELCRTRIGCKHAVAGENHPASGTEFHFRLIPPQWRRLAVGEKLGLMYVYGAIRYVESKMHRVQLQQYRQLRTYKLRPPTRADDMVIGAEMLEPFRNLIWRCEGADSNYLSNSCTRYRMLLLDRPVQQTYTSLAEVLTEEQKQLVRDYKENFEQEFISCRRQNRQSIVATLLLNRRSKLYEIFVGQRDEHMAQMMFAALVNDRVRKLFCVVGRTHVNGVLVKLKELFVARMAEG